MPMSLLRRLRALVFRRSSERDIRDEVQFHLAMEARAIQHGGANAENAAREARRRFGGVDRYTEELRDERGTRIIEHIVRDVRYALRAARRTPGFSAIVVLTLGVAIGATTAIFSVVNAVLLLPLPFARPQEVVRLFAQNPDASQPRFGVSYADYLDWRAQTRSFSSMAVFANTTLTLTSDGEPERLAALNVTSNFFDLLETKPFRGRLFGSDDADGVTPTVVLSHGFWMRRFGGDSSIVGREIPLAGRARQVIGILPSGFWLDGRPIDAAIVLNPAQIPNGANHGQHLFEAIARLRPGATLEQAQQDLRTVAARLATEHADITGWSANVFRFDAELVRGTRNPLLILFAAAGFVLLIGCINIANLLSVRATTRAREVGLRQALGASRGRLVSQLLAEAAVLTAAGGALGVLIATVGTRAMLRLVPQGVLPRQADVRVDSAALVFAVAVSLLTAVVVGLWPALRATMPDVMRALREGGRTQAGGRRTARVRQTLVVAEVSLAMVMLVCSTLVLRSLYNIVRVDPGFRSDRVVTMRVPPAGPDSTLTSFYHRFVTSLEARPGIEAAAAANTPPIAGGGIITGIRLAGNTDDQNRGLMSMVTAVTPGYFRTMGMRLVRGRDIEWIDQVPVIVASEAAAKRLWPGQDALGKRVGFGGPANPDVEVIGIVSDTRARGLTAEPAPMLYLSQNGATSVARTMSLVVRGVGDQATTVAAARAALKEVAPNLPVYNVQSMKDVIDLFTAQPRLNTTLLSIFAAIALLLATIGIYGVISFSVSQRVQEFGVRIALGAQRGDVARLVVREGFILGAVGVTLGAAGALGATRAVRTWLFGIEPTDAMTFVTTIAVLMAVALFASYLPAKRATRVDPILAMRGE
jgi:predicted permease